jgi:hypothetical protein
MGIRHETPVRIAETTFVRGSETGKQLGRRVVRPTGQVANNAVEEKVALTRFG